jgi:hypothetical protein
MKGAQHRSVLDRDRAGESSRPALARIEATLAIEWLGLGGSVDSARVWRITRAEPHRWSHAPCKRFNSNVRARCPGSAKSVSRSY